MATEKSAVESKEDSNVPSARPFCNGVCHAPVSGPWLHCVSCSAKRMVVLGKTQSLSFNICLPCAAHFGRNAFAGLGHLSHSVNDHLMILVMNQEQLDRLTIPGEMQPSRGDADLEMAPLEDDDDDARDDSGRRVGWPHYVGPPPAVVPSRSA